MKHSHYYQVKAQTHFELGNKLAILFKSSSLKTYSSMIQKIAPRKSTFIEAHKYLELSEMHFPHYIEELRGYAHGLEVDFDSFWLTFLFEELNTYPEKCTSCFSADGKIIGHNEDFPLFFEDTISILEKTIGGITIFELFYINSLGGSACGINSHGFVQTINTLNHTDQQIGVPRNIIARWLSETKNPENEYEKLKKIKRSMGYSHTFCNLQGDVANIESSGTESLFTKPSLPFVHTNHYLTPLVKYEAETIDGNSKDRFMEATIGIGSVKTAEDMMKLLEHISELPSNKNRESNTIARMVFDLKKKSIWCWLARERAKKWIEYPLQFI
ncbi:MAG: C45 family autoproteolytic acyltransferase/hydrolase [Candidatus Roizmanbacteria bacterium]|nr:C45 family autoproteolytic acyltransferase/hydrolase [Candidatus Roizmanbacteria bacterium]